MVVTASIVDLSLLLTPLAISVAILRYQLFEIDRLIKRTLAYGLLTTLLAGLYLALVALLGIAASAATRRSWWQRRHSPSLPSSNLCEKGFRLLSIAASTAPDMTQSEPPRNFHPGSGTKPI